MSLTDNSYQYKNFEFTVHESKLGFYWADKEAVSEEYFSTEDECREAYKDNIDRMSYFIGRACR